MPETPLARQTRSGQGHADEDKRDRGVGGVAEVPVGPAGDYLVAGLDGDLVLEGAPSVTIDQARSPIPAMIKAIPATAATDVPGYGQRARRSWPVGASVGIRSSG
jgi:hypothetical protein